MKDWVLFFLHNNLTLGFIPLLGAVLSAFIFLNKGGEKDLLQKNINKFMGIEWILIGLYIAEGYSMTIVLLFVSRALFKL